MANGGGCKIAASHVSGGAFDYFENKLYFMRILNNPQAGRWVLPDGYKDLGWQRHSGNCEEIKQCREKGHNDNGKHCREFDNSLYMNRGTNIIYICDECKIVWHIDMSD